jgi:phosphoribosylglycinamide formyltransferase 1
MTTISFLASHGGSAAKQIIDAIAREIINARVGVIITNNRNAEIYRWCNKHNIQVAYISTQTHPEEEQKDAAICAALNDVKTDLVILSGYMKIIGPLTLTHFHNRILNIHPSLLPRHGGKGLFGDSVHQSVIDSGETESGATVHFVTEHYDEGPIVAQQKVMLSPNETVPSLKHKVQSIEGDLYIAAINKILHRN